MSLLSLLSFIHSCSVFRRERKRRVDDDDEPHHNKRRIKRVVGDDSDDEKQPDEEKQLDVEEPIIAAPAKHGEDQVQHVDNEHPDDDEAGKQCATVSSS